MAHTDSVAAHFAENREMALYRTRIKCCPKSAEVMMVIDAFLSLPRCEIAVAAK